MKLMKINGVWSKLKPEYVHGFSRFGLEETMLKFKQTNVTLANYAGNAEIDDTDEANCEALTNSCR